MARPQRRRRICCEPEFLQFHSADSSGTGENILTVDEFEVIRLVDYEHFTHEQCAVQMDISRTTVSEIYETARYKIADCIVNGKGFSISGGNYRLCDGSADSSCRMNCWKNQLKEYQGMGLPVKGDMAMRVAVTYENGNVFQHFGHTEQFKVYDIEDGVIKSAQVIGSDGFGHGALAGFLAQNQITALICGGIGGGAQIALANAGITLYGGVSGSADAAVEALISGKLEYNPNVMCNHHAHHEGGHACGSHGCGEHSCH